MTLRQRMAASLFSPGPVEFNFIRTASPEEQLEHLENLMAAERRRADLSTAVLVGLLDMIPAKLPDGTKSRTHYVERPATKPAAKRNDPCPCGSGKKWKKCCRNKEAECPSTPRFITPTTTLETTGPRPSS